MNCDQAKTEIIAYLKGELTTKQKDRLEEHFARCPNCRHELEEARRLLSWTESASQEAVVKKVEEIIDSAIAADASDIHLESQRNDGLVVRRRIDGVMHEVEQIDPMLRQGIVTRIKMMADMNVSETRIPQDGRIRWPAGSKEPKYDIRASCWPFIYGEGIVMRILDQSSVLLGLDKLGFCQEHLDGLREMVAQPNGLIVLSGPTGSGKTTTIYSMLLEIDSTTRKVVTIEDPVEYFLRGINQAQVFKGVGLTFPTALRASLRHDPDVIYVGEVREPETTTIALEAALVGHVVLTTMHTQNAVGVVTRLLDMGMPPYQVSATLIGVVSQRLARKVCGVCGEPVDTSADDPLLKHLGVTADDLRNHKMQRGAGCETCKHTGYKGRIGLYEILSIDRELAAMISNGAGAAEIEAAAVAKGFHIMKHDAKQKVLAGLTTPEEACRVLAYND